MTTHAGTAGTPYHGELTGGFGLADFVGPAEQCSTCRSDKPVPTDLFCREQDHFLPLVNWDGAARAGLVATVAAMIYGLFWLAAERASSVPILLATGMVGLGVCLLPLRTHRRTVWLAALAYVTSFTVIFAGHATNGGTHHRFVVLAFFVALAILAVHAVFLLHDEASTDKAIFSRGPGNGLVELGAVPLIVAMFSGVSWVLSPMVVDDPNVREYELGTALFALCLTSLVVGGVGLVEGLGAVDEDAPGIRLPSRGPRVDWHARPSTLRRGGRGTVIDRIAELTWATITRLADAVRIIMVTTARVTVNTLLELGHLLLRLLIHILNLLIRLVFVLAKMISAVTISLVAGAAKILAIAISFAALSLVNLGLPVAALLGAEACAVALSEHGRRYLLEGTLTDLWWFMIQSAAALALVTLAWILMADQRPRASLRSAYRSAASTGPRLLVFVALGGWLLTVLTVFDLGRIHAGWATWTASAVLLGSLAVSQFLRDKPKNLPAGFA
ncbi:hypothetical protein ACGFNU_50410 [Spirillospora sp. NPDC048911]|uniref:hypothetical protein n=1 Tax=Spirillospora sp. NPDC048911 TaxID=3364527 RepID=UPI003715B6ED